jgi:hypothetical protein
MTACYVILSLVSTITYIVVRIVFETRRTVRTWIQVGTSMLFAFNASKISVRNFKSAKLAVPKIDFSVPDGLIVIGLLFETTFPVCAGLDVAVFFLVDRFCWIDFRNKVSYLLLGLSTGFNRGNLDLVFVAKSRSCVETAIGLS